MDLHSKTNWLLQIFVDSIHDPKVGVIFDPKSLIQALADVVGKHMSTNVTELDHSNDGQGQELLLWCGYWSLSACRSIVPEVKVTEIRSFSQSIVVSYSTYFPWMCCNSYSYCKFEIIFWLLVAQFDLHCGNFMLFNPRSSNAVGCMVISLFQ